MISRRRLHNCCISLVWRECHVPNLGDTISSKHEARLQKHASGIKIKMQHFVCLLEQPACRNCHLGRATVIVSKVLAQGVKDVTVVNVYDIMLDMPTDTKATPASKTCN